MTCNLSFFDYDVSVASLVNTGLKRSSNQDEVICCPEAGFYAVSDGMGGLLYGGKTSQLIQQTLPKAINRALNEYLIHQSIAHAAQLLGQLVGQLSDLIYHSGNSDGHIHFGATLSGVWLTGRHAFFVNLGDSRGYLLQRYKRGINQVTIDHNVAALLVQQGEITREEVRGHPSSSILTRFMGMNAPASPDVFIREVQPGDRILLCSDGLHGMVEDTSFPEIMRSSKSLSRISEHLVNEANANGGRDNISVVLIKIKSKECDS